MPGRTGGMTIVAGRTMTMQIQAGAAATPIGRLPDAKQLAPPSSYNNTSRFAAQVVTKTKTKTKTPSANNTSWSCLMWFVSYRFNADLR